MSENFIVRVWYSFLIKALIYFSNKKNFCKILSIKINLSTAFYLETNWQSKIVNQKRKKHLCTFVHYQQDDLSDKLVMAEFVANNNKLIFTQLSPFFVIKGLYPYIGFDQVKLFDIGICKRIFN